jgi:hypothetical protein
LRTKTVKTVIGLASAGALACVGAVGLATSAALASSAAQRVPASAFNPVITGPAPPLPENCPQFLTSDPWSLDFTSGNGVFYGTSNKNGDWGGGNAEGQAVLSDGTVNEYSGHANLWVGGGQNSVSLDPTAPPTKQAEQGATLTFNGSGIAGSISIHATMHMTQNNNGQPTANVQRIAVSCS